MEKCNKISQDTAPDLEKTLFDRKALKAETGQAMNVRYGRLIVEYDLWNEAFDLLDDPDPQVAFRAAWSLEKAFFSDPGAFTPHLERFLGQYLAAANHSVQRSYSKMLSYMLKTDVFEPTPTEREKVVTVCFDRLIDPRTPIAVRAWTMTVLGQLSPLGDWADEAFRDILRNLSETGSPGVRNSASKLLKKLTGKTGRHTIRNGKGL